MVPRRSTDSSWEPALATTSTCAVKASLSPSHAAREPTASRPAARENTRWRIMWYGVEWIRERRDGARAAGPGRGSGAQAAERPDQAEEHVGAPQSHQLE